ncbi:MAG TPA: winged helix-turn-helix domain-containing protein [Ktedonobacteraceae bacterium]|nr:winged helix-turn-helix domain-containing protein [Ktedonobacteraceae bacterium]
MPTDEHQEMPKRRQGLIVQIEASLVYEFFLSLCVFSDSGNSWRPYEVGEAWFEAIRGKLAPDLLEIIKRFGFQSHEMWGHISALACTCPPPRDVPALLAYLKTIDPLELRLHLLGYYVRQHRRSTAPDVIYAAAQGDGEAQRELLRTSLPVDARWQEALRWHLSRDVTETKERLLEIVHGWYDKVFREQEMQLLPILTQDAEAKLALQAAHSPEQLIEICTGWEYVPEPGIRRVVLIPSYVIRPFNNDTESGDTQLFFYPVTDASILADPSAPPAYLLNLVKALGDERRLRILKMLSGGSYTLQELADEFGVAKTTIHHHLVQLRSAGLVRMRISDKRFSLRRYPIDNLGEALRKYLNFQYS